MKVRLIELQNFRNYENLRLELNPNINFIYGENGQGKTNLLESIHLCTCAKSHRTSKDQELKNKQKNFYQVKLAFLKDEELQELKIHYDEKRHIFYNDIKLTRLVDMLGIFHSVIFAPEDIQIVREGPAYRRQYMDLLLSQTSKMYFNYLSKGQKLLQNKNSLLKQLNAKYFQSSFNAEKYDINDLYEQCRPWDLQISQVWAYIFLSRLILMNDLKNKIKEAYEKISLAKENLEVYYKPHLAKEIIRFLQKKRENNCENIRENVHENIRESKKDNDIYELLTEKISNPNEIIQSNYYLQILDELQTFFLKKMESEFYDDLVRKQVSSSYTKDDIVFNLNKENIKNYASQGQIRSIVLSLKIAELNYLSDILNFRPVLLLDDVLSELDINRRNALLSLISSEQVIITCTDVLETKKIFEENGLSEKISYFHVEKGTVRNT